MIKKKHTLTGIFLLAIVAFGSGTMLAEYVEALTSNDRPLAIVRRFKPDVLIKHSDATQWEESEIGKPLFNNDTLRTDDNGYAAVQFMDNSLVKVKPNSLLIIRGEVVDKNNTASRLAVELGEVFLNVTKRQSDFEVQTPTGVATVKGTSFQTRINGTLVEFTVYSGLVTVRAIESGQQVDLTRGKKATVDGKGSNISVNDVSDDELENNQNEYDELESGTKPKTLKLRFKNSAGQTREVEIQYFENEQ